MMRVLLVHPSVLLYSEAYLRLEPLGMQYVGQALLDGGHEVSLLDLQVHTHRDFDRRMRRFAPEAVGFSLNYLANVPEVIDLAKRVKSVRPDMFIFIGGHSASFIPEELIAHGAGAIDAVVMGEGEHTAALLLGAWPDIHGLPGVATHKGRGPKPTLQADLDALRPARKLTRRRRRYFIGELDPCASIEFSRGCPWDCSFCSAWTFYGRSYRQADPKLIVDEIEQIREPNLFIVDDVAFVHPEHGMAIADEIERRGIRKRYYLETRCDVLIRNAEVFERWAKLGLQYMFLGMESLDAEQLDLFRKRTTPNQNFEALEIARRFGIDVAINLIADPQWDEAQFARATEWATTVPEIVHLTVATPYPGTELFHAHDPQLTTVDYRLYDIQHAVTPTKLPLDAFYKELVKAQSLINAKFMGWKIALEVGRILAGQLARGQTNFLRMLFKFAKVYNADRFHADHSRPVRYGLRRPQEYPSKPHDGQLLVHLGKVKRATGQTVALKRRGLVASEAE